MKTPGPDAAIKGLSGGNVQRAVLARELSGDVDVLIVATIAHTVMVFVRQRRRDYAVLKAIGFTPGQVRTTVLTQSAAVVAAGLVAAIPLGAAAGRWLWTGFAGRIGVVVEAVVPLPLLAVCLIITLLAVQGTALLPASVARRTPPGRTLHGE